MILFKFFIICFLVLLMVDPVETQVTMRPFIGECAPYSNLCIECVSFPGCYYYTMERDVIQGDVCWPSYMNVPMRQYALDQFRTVAKCEAVFGTTPAPAEIPTHPPGENEIEVPKSGEIPIIIGILLASSVILLFAVLLGLLIYRRRRQDYRVNQAVELNLNLG